jgi:phosphoglycolate phosphatase/beta-phosphoglucomutase
MGNFTTHAGLLSNGLTREDDKMVPVLRAILFDFNGVLVDDEPIHLELFRRVLGEEGIVLGPEHDYRSYVGMDDRSCFADALQKSGESATVPRLMRLIARKASYYQERMRESGYPFFPGAAELVAELAAAGRMLGIVSGALREEVESALRQAGLKDRFKVLVTAEDVTEGKPDPEGYRRALEALNSRPPLPERLLHPHEVLAVEDSPAGLSAAADVGLTTLAVAHTYPPHRLRMADAVAESLEGMTLGRLERLLAEASRR